MKFLIIALLTFSLPAAAAEVFVNGVNVDGLTNHNFEKVNVRLDERGNVQIDAPGYSVKKVSLQDKAPEPAGSITQKYYLVTEQSPSGMTEYEIDLFLNGKYFRTVKNGDEQLVTDITRSLKPGRNTVIAQAKKRYANPDRPRSQSRAHVFRVIIGEGTTANDQVTIEKQVMTFTRTAADTNDVTQEFSFTTR
ncbi:MAG: hypothetical protein DI536_26645 [Archangium gephyra]|uniref:PEGA domain-containing protein n=1 Tax=Archangium gephyra TaxID=48 RepID=A0A2W5VC96_9BACT|nr:MAG: hypothetical protein DI536_26645 [Archangium gephyra]